MPVVKTKPSSALFLGIDPGASGGLSLIDSSYNVLFCEKMGETELNVHAQLKAIHSFTRSNNSVSPIRAVIERVWARPLQGAQAGFAYGANYGALRMGLAAFAIPFDDPVPKTWMDALKIPPTKATSVKGKKRPDHEVYKERKEKLLAKAKQQFPSLPLWTVPKSKTIQLAICDSLLIALYCRLHYGEA